MVKEQIDWYKEQLDRDAAAFKAFPEEARNDRLVVKHALDKDPFNMWYLGDQTKNDKSFAMNVLCEYPTFHLNKLGSALLMDPEVVRFAMERNQTFGLRDLEHICKNFADNKELMDRAIEKLESNPLLVKGEITIGKAMAACYQGKDKVLEMIRENPETYRLMSAEMKENPEVAMVAIKRAPYLINEVPAKLQNTQFRTAAVMSIDGVEQELSLKHRQEVAECKENLQKTGLKDRINGAQKNERVQNHRNHRNYDSMERDER